MIATICENAPKTELVPTDPCFNYEHCGTDMINEGKIDDNIKLCHHCYCEHFEEFESYILEHGEDSE